MSFLYSYDAALQQITYTRFGTILGINTLGPTQEAAINKGVILCPKAIAKREVAEKRTQIFLEFINIYRSSVNFSWERQRTVVARRGLHALRPDGVTETIRVDAIDLNYNLWFWSNSLDKINLCVEKYLQWQQDNPKISLTYDEVYMLTPDLIFGAVVDESNIEDMYSTGKVWTFRMPVKIEAWLPKSPEEAEKIIQKIRFTMYDKDEVESYTDIVVEDSNQDTALEEALRMLRTNLYGIIAADPVSKTFTVAADRTEDFNAEDSNDIIKFIVENSTGNNGSYTMLSAVYSESENETIIYVQEAVSSEIADGNLFRATN